jgi:pimeloyl-ACP methyl ester carboxylesterase
MEWFNGAGDWVMKKVLIGFGCVVVGLYLLATVALFVFEAKLIFLPPDFPPATTPAVANLPFEDLHIPVDATTHLHAWWIPAAAPTQKTILFFHGNGYSLESEANLEAPMWHETGANVLAVDYRGYGSSSKMQTDGPSTEADASAALRYLTEQRHVARADIWIAGRSIGTGVATQLAAETPHASGLILISPISSVKDVANQLWVYRYLFRPVQWLGHKNDFNSAAKISAVQMPVLIISGAADQLAPPSMAQQLYARAHEPKTIHMIEGAGHNDILEIGDGNLVREIQSFMATNASLAQNP